MNSKFILIAAFLFIVTLTWQCKTDCPEVKEKTEAVTVLDEPGTVIADTITYDVIIKQTDSSKVWEEQFLSHLDHNLLIDSIFAGVYSGRIIPYDFFTGETLSLRQLKEMEGEPWFTREGIGKIQFSEIWYFNKNNTALKKKVYSLVLGMEQFDNQGNIRGYKPVFKIYME